MTEAEFHEASGSMQGWCTGCKELTRDMTEPDAEDYDCPKCGEDTVMGVELAMVTGDVEIE